MKSAHESLLAQRSAHQRRLDELVIRSATFGNTTPPEVKTEIEDIQTEIFKIDASLDALERFKDLQDRTETTNSGDRRDQELKQHIMVATVMATVTEVSSIKKFVQDEFAKVYRMFFWFGVGIGTFIVMCLGTILFIIEHVK